MRVLALSYFLPPALFPQSIQIGRLLEYLDGEIAVVCAPPANSALDAGNLSRNVAFRLEVEDKRFLSGLSARLARWFVPFYGCVPDEMRAWSSRAERQVLAELDRRAFKPDIIVSFGEPMSDHLLGRKLKRALKLPWVAHFSDPWSDNPFRRRNFLSNIVNRKLEKEVIKEADRIVFTSDETRDLVMRKYAHVAHDKASVLPHSFEPMPSSPRRLNGRITVRYLGNFYGHRTPAPLFRALQILQDRSPRLLENVRFELIGQTPGRMRRSSALRDLPKDLVVFLDPVPYRRSLQLMADSDLLLVIDGADDLSVFLPSKLIEYIGSGTPVFGIVPPGASSRVITQCGGLVADPRHADAIAQRLGDVLEKIVHHRQTGEMVRWSDPAIRAQFEASNVAAQFSGILARTMALSA